MKIEESFYKTNLNRILIVIKNIVKKENSFKIFKMKNTNQCFINYFNKNNNNH